MRWQVYDSVFLVRKVILPKEEAKPVWAIQLTRLPWLVADLKFQLAYLFGFAMHHLLLGKPERSY